MRLQQKSGGAIDKILSLMTFLYVVSNICRINRVKRPAK